MTKIQQTMDSRIAAAFANEATSADVSILLAEVEAAASAAEAEAEAARARALDPLLSRDDVKLARREMEDAAFTRDRLHQAGTKLAERVEALKALEAERHARAEHKRFLADRDRLAEETARFAEPISRSLSFWRRPMFSTVKFEPTTKGQRGSATFDPSYRGDASVVEIVFQAGPRPGGLRRPRRAAVAEQSTKA